MSLLYIALEVQSATGLLEREILNARGYDLTNAVRKDSSAVTQADIDACSGIVVSREVSTTPLEAIASFNAQTGCGKPLVTFTRGVSWLTHLRIGSSASQASGVASCYITSEGSAISGLASGTYPMLSTVGTLQFIRTPVPAGTIQHVNRTNTISGEIHSFVVPVGATLINGGAAAAKIGWCMGLSSTDAINATADYKTIMGAVVLDTLGDPSLHTGGGGGGEPGEVLYPNTLLKLKTATETQLWTMHYKAINGDIIPPLPNPDPPFIARIDNVGRTGAGSTLATTQTIEYGTNGDYTLTPGGVYRNIAFRCRVFMASDVDMKYCTFQGDQFRTVDTGLMVCPDSATNYLVEYCNFVPRWPNEYWHGVKGGRHGTFRRNYFKNVVDGLSLYPLSANGLCTYVVEENYIHKMAYFTPCSYQGDSRTHNDPIQVQGGDGGIIRNNTLIADASDEVGNGLDPSAVPSPNFAAPGVTGNCIGLTPSSTGGQITNLLVEDNRLSYGKYGIAIVKNSPAASNIGIIRNNTIDVATIHNFNITGQSPAQAKRGIAKMTSMSATFEGNVDIDGVTPVTIYDMTVM